MSSDEDDFFDSANPFADDADSVVSAVAADGELSSSRNEDPSNTIGESSQKASSASHVLFTPERIIFDGDDLTEDEMNESRIPDLPVEQLPPGARVWICAVREVRVLGTAIWTADLIPFCGTGVPGTIVRHGRCGTTTVVRFEFRAGGDPSEHAVFSESMNDNSNTTQQQQQQQQQNNDDDYVHVSLTFPRAALALHPPLRPPGAKSMNPNQGGGMKFGLDPRGGPSIPKRLTNDMIKQQEQRTLTDFDREATVSCRDDLRVVFGKLEAGDVSSARIVPVPPPAKLAVDSLLHLFEKSSFQSPSDAAPLELYPEDDGDDDEEGLGPGCGGGELSQLPRWVLDAHKSESATAKLRAWRAHLACGDSKTALRVTQSLPSRVPAAVRDFVDAVNQGGAVVRAALEAACGPSFTLCPHQTYEFGRTLHCDRYLVRGDIIAQHSAGPLAVAVAGADLPLCGNCAAIVPALPKQRAYSNPNSATIPHPLISPSSAGGVKIPLSDEQLEARRTSSGWIECPRGTASVFCSPRCIRDAWAGHLSVERGGRDHGRVFRSVFGFLQFQATHFSDEIRGALLLLVRCFSLVVAQQRRNQKMADDGGVWSTQEMRVAFACLGVFPAPNDISIEGDLLKFIKVTLAPALAEALDPETEAPALTVELLVSVFSAVYQFQRVLPVLDALPVPVSDDDEYGESAEEEEEEEHDDESISQGSIAAMDGAGGSASAHMTTNSGTTGEALEDSDDDFFTSTPPPLSSVPTQGSMQKSVSAQSTASASTALRQQQLALAAAAAQVSDNSSGTSHVAAESKETTPATSARGNRSIVAVASEDAGSSSNVRRVAVLSPLCSSFCSRNSEPPNCRLVLLGAGQVALVVDTKVIPKNIPLQCAL